MKLNNVINKINSNLTIISIQLLSTLLLIYFVYILNILPLRYFAIVTGILILLLIGVFFLMRNKRDNKDSKSKIRVLVGRIISLCLSVFMIVASSYIYRGNSFLLNGLGSGYQTHAVSIVVMKDSSMKELKDTQDKKYAMSTASGGATILSNAVDAIEKDLGKTIDIDYPDTILQMADNLYEGKCDAIIINEANRAIVQEKHKDFNTETKVIYQTKIKEKIEGSASEANITEETFNILVSGNDLFGSVEEVSRSDVNMLVTVNPKTKQILLTSIPRDTYVRLGTSNQYDKLTHAGTIGVEESVKTVEKLFDCEIDYYFRINFTSLIEIVDALGGITINNPHKFTNGLDASNGGPQYTFEEGDIELDGEKALIFSRERTTVPDGDNTRGQNQQRVLSGIIKKACSSAIITRYNKVLDSVNGTFDTDLSDASIKSFIQMQLDDMAEWDIQTVQVEGYGDTSTECYLMPGWKLSVTIPYEKSITKIADYISKMEENKEKIEVNNSSTASHYTTEADKEGR